MQDNARIGNGDNGVQPYKTLAFNEYLTFCALGGMMVSDTGSLSGKTLKEFCAEVGVDEATTWRWKKNIPNFAELVRDRRNEIVPLARETAALNRLFLIGMTSLPTKTEDLIDPRTGKVKTIKTGNLHYDQRAAVDSLKTYLGHHSKLKLPTQPVEVDASQNLIELANIARKRHVIEGEVVEPISNT